MSFSFDDFLNNLNVDKITYLSQNNNIYNFRFTSKNKKNRQFKIEFNTLFPQEFLIIRIHNIYPLTKEFAEAVLEVLDRLYERLKESMKLKEVLGSLYKISGDFSLTNFYTRIEKLLSRERAKEISKIYRQLIQRYVLADTILGVNLYQTELSN